MRFIIALVALFSFSIFAQDNTIELSQANELRTLNIMNATFKADEVGGQTEVGLLTFKVRFSNSCEAGLAKDVRYTIEMNASGTVVTIVNIPTANRPYCTTQYDPTYKTYSLRARFC